MKTIRTLIASLAMLGIISLPSGFEGKVLAEPSGSTIPLSGTWKGYEAWLTILYERSFGEAHHGE